MPRRTSGGHNRDRRQPGRRRQVIAVGRLLPTPRPRRAAAIDHRCRQTDAHRAMFCVPHRPGTRVLVCAPNRLSDLPLVRADSDALDAVRLIAEQRLPGLLVTDAAGRPSRILPASPVVRLLVPAYIQDDPSLAGVLSEITADHVADKLRGRPSSGRCCPRRPGTCALSTPTTRSSGGPSWRARAIAIGRGGVRR